MPTYIIGDIHGEFDGFERLLLNAGIIIADWTWQAGDSTLCLVGDYVNRGADGLRVLDYLISLQIQAEHAGGEVVALLGNHEPVLMAAQRFGTVLNRVTDTSFYDNWRQVGVENDLEMLTPEHIAWFTHLPAMVRLGDALVVHADSDFYLRYGDTIEAVNQHFEAILRSFDPDVWSAFLKDFSEHRVFWHDPTRVDAMLARFGGKRLIHGHTNFTTLTQYSETDIDYSQPLTYANGRVMNVDGALVSGKPGFVYQLETD